MNYKEMSQEQINNCFLKECENGNLEKVKYFLLSKDLNFNAEIDSYSISSINEDWIEEGNNNNYGEALSCVCEKGNLEIVEYLLTSPDLKVHANIRGKHDRNLGFACQSGNFNLVKFLLTSEKLKEKANINGFGGFALIMCLKYKKYDIANWLLTAPELKEHANISGIDNDKLPTLKIHGIKLKELNYDSAFIHCCLELNIEGLKFLLRYKELQNTDVLIGQKNSQGWDLIKALNEIIDCAEIFSSFNKVLNLLDYLYNEVGMDRPKYRNYLLSCDSIKKLIEKINLNKELIKDLKQIDKKVKVNKV